MTTTILVGGGALAAASAAYVTALAAVRRADRAYPSSLPVASPWWFGYARDGVNLFGFLAFSGGFALLGLPGSLALLAGASLALGVYGLDYLFNRRVGANRGALLTGATAVALVLLAVAARDALRRALHAVMGALL